MRLSASSISSLDDNAIVGEPYQRHDRATHTSIVFKRRHEITLPIEGLN
jgi:hypothetical protein